MVQVALYEQEITLLTMVYMKPQVAMIAKMPMNLYESRSNLKSAGGGYNIAAIKAPFLVRKPVLITLARTRWSPWHLKMAHYLFNIVTVGSLKCHVPGLYYRRATVQSVMRAFFGVVQRLVRRQ